MEGTVTVVVCTYNSDDSKLKKTLFSIIMQKKVELDIIITDDGSRSFDREDIVSFFLKYEHKSYQIIEHEQNQGTVKNIRDGVRHASGEYIYAISPGDYFYNELSLYNILNFAKRRDIDYCFGIPVLYSCKSNRITISPCETIRIPQIYNVPFLDQKGQLIALFYGHNPIGATYFRKREIFLQDLNEICDRVKYIEDKATSALYLLEHQKKIRYYNKPIIWYECDTGISTTSSDIWKKRMKKDEQMIKKILYEKHSDSRIVRAICTNIKNYFDVYLISVFFRKIGDLRIRFFSSKSVKCNISYLKNILKRENL